MKYNLRKFLSRFASLISAVYKPVKWADQLSDIYWVAALLLISLLVTYGYFRFHVQDPEGYLWQGIMVLYGVTFVLIFHWFSRRLEV